MSYRNFKDSQSYANLLKAFAYEAEAIAKYTFHREIAKNEGRADVVTLYDELITNETEHAEVIAKELDLIQDTSRNIVMDMATEDRESHEIYKGFAKAAYAEGDERLGDMFTLIGRVEGHHYDYLKDIAFAENDQYPIQSPEDTTTVWFWKCTKCGNTYDVSDPKNPELDLPEICSICGHLKEDFILQKRVVALF